MTRSAVALGSNLGDRLGHLEAGSTALGDVGRVVARSPVYETEPVGGPDQGPYLNAVAVVETSLAPRELMDRLLEIERAQGRVRRERWGPRSLDLDLLLYGDQSVNEPGLTVPHPRMTERRFVLQPLLDVWPDAALPDGTRLDSYLDGVADQRIEPLDETSVEIEDAEFHPWTALAVFLIFMVVASMIWRIIAWLD
jgi:2-amino-4-hydroxy-6-hydroxymethyldihydropteridine diphosphokinase